MVDFLLPESDKDQGENPIVDSLAVVSEWTVVAKCALHGLIYMWDLKVNFTILCIKTQHMGGIKYQYSTTIEQDMIQNQVVPPE